MATSRTSLMRLLASITWPPFSRRSYCDWAMAADARRMRTADFIDIILLRRSTGTVLQQSPLQPFHRKLRRLRHGHHGHDAVLYGIGDYQVRRIRDAAR